MNNVQKIDFTTSERSFRASLINSATGCKPAHLIATKSLAGIENVAVFSSIVHLGSDPALIGFIHRPIGDFSHTYKNIVATQYYTINHIHQNIVRQAHQTQLKYDENTSEFSACGLSPVYHQKFPAPFVGESKIQMGVKLLEIKDLHFNNTKFIIGEIIDLYCDPDCIKECGTIALDLASSLAVAGQETYFSLTPI